MTTSSALSFSLLGTWLSVSAGAVEPPRMPPDELRRLILTHDNALAIIDVRSSSEFHKGHIQGARNVPAVDIDADKASARDRVVVYCGEDQCPLSRDAAIRLIAAGYPRVSLLQGGLAGWILKKFPVVKGDDSNGKPVISMVDAERARKRLDGGALAIDVRAANEFRCGHLPGARNLPLEGLVDSLSELTRSAELIVYDREGGRARKGTQILAAAGLNAHELAGGISGWMKRGFPLEIK